MGENVTNYDSRPDVVRITIPRLRPTTKPVHCTLIPAYSYC